MDPSLSCCQSFDRRGQWIFRIIQDKSKPTRVAMIWLRVKVNRTRLCTAVHFARNKIKYQKSRENGLLQYKLYACTIACLSFISLYKGSFTNVTARCLLHRNRRKAKNYHSQYLWQKGNLVKLFVNLHHQDYKRPPKIARREVTHNFSFSHSANLLHPGF